MRDLSHELSRISGGHADFDGYEFTRFGARA
jgi:hypothetical protein